MTVCLYICVYMSCFCLFSLHCFLFIIANFSVDLLFIIANFSVDHILLLKFLSRSLLMKQLPSYASTVQLYWHDGKIYSPWPDRLYVTVGTSTQRATQGMLGLVFCLQELCIYLYLLYKVTILQPFPSLTQQGRGNIAIFILSLFIETHLRKN